MTRPSLALTISLLLLGGCRHFEASEQGPRMCGFSYSPNGEHVAYFTWDGGRSVDAVACNGNCEPVLQSPRSLAAYRWAGPDRLEFARDGSGGDVKIAQVHGLSVYSVPMNRIGAARFVRVPADCGAIESLVVED